MTWQSMQLWEDAPPYPQQPHAVKEYILVGEPGRLNPPSLRGAQQGDEAIQTSTDE